LPIEISFDLESVDVTSLIDYVKKSMGDKEKLVRDINDINIKQMIIIYNHNWYVFYRYRLDLLEMSPGRDHAALQEDSCCSGYFYFSP